MPRTDHSLLIFLFSCLTLLPSLGVFSQEVGKAVPLSVVLSELERRFDVKFSYVDADIEGLEVEVGDFDGLARFIQAIEGQTQIKINKLNERYYALVQCTLIDICGKVLDNFAENNIPAATVEVLGSDIAIVTDMDGSFRLSQIPRKAALRVRYLGYATKIIEAERLLSQNGCPNVLLAQNVEKLEEVIVYEFLTSGIVKQEDGSISLNTGELGTLPGLIEPDVLQTVQALPGIKSIDETVSDINIRGGTNDQNLILWNGIKMYQSGHFFGLISAFNPYLTDKVTVYKNGTPPKFGDGVSGVISMETKNTIDGDFHGGAGINFISGDVFGQIPIREDLAFQFSARRSTTDFLNTPTYENFTRRVFQDSQISNQQNQLVDRAIENEVNFFFYDFTGKVLYNINDDHKLRFSFIGMDNDLDFRETQIDIDETTRSELNQTNLSAGLQLQSQWTPDFASNLNVYVTRYDLEALGISANPAQELIQNNRVLESALKLDTRYTVSDRLYWSNGYQFIETGIQNLTLVTQPDFQSEVKGVLRIHAPYSEVGYQSYDKGFIANAGLRANLIQNIGTFTKFLLEPRLSLNFRLAKHLRGNILGEFKSQSTNQVIDLEQNFLGIEKRRWTISDEDQLPITRSKQGSFGLNYEKNALYLGLEAFYKQVDGVSTRTQGFQSENQFNGELGSYEIKGVEFLINKKGKNFSTWLSYTYNKNDYTYDSIVPSTFPNNLDIRHTVTVATTYDIGKLKIGLGLNYRTGKPFTEPLAGDAALNRTIFPARINYEAPNSSRLPEYLRVDASATYGFDLGNNSKATIGISVLNVTDRRNILNRYYQINELDELELIENFSLGLTPNISFRVRF
ncbi:MAG: carboxypeptidase-like regulatory domain-containing protein [Flavobacteriaceae bacterium]|nr:carboxypeptidase-like regulatory domain-containing protein [Flavobacteriaceae bacterium]